MTTKNSAFNLENLRNRQLLSVFVEKHLDLPQDVGIIGMVGIVGINGII